MAAGYESVNAFGANVLPVIAFSSVSAAQSFPSRERLGRGRSIHSDGHPHRERAVCISGSWHEHAIPDAQLT
jgi:hypothetical protein